MASFKIETIYEKNNEIKRLYEFCGFTMSDDFVVKARTTLKKNRIAKSKERGPFDLEIEKKLMEAIRKTHR